MHDAGFQMLFWLVVGMIVLGAIVTAVGALAHFAIFGAVFGLIVKRMTAFQARPAGLRARQRCRHCKSFVSSAVAECPNCGAPAV